MLTLKEEMALAVLRGDDVAAYALADKLIEERDEGPEAMRLAAIALREGPQAYDGFTVYRWAEFQAFCRRAGILWDLRTIGMTFTIKAGVRFSVQHEYAASDQLQAEAVIDTTTLQNEHFNTSSPPVEQG